MATPIFPAHLFCPSGVRSYIERKVLSGGTSLSGVEDQVIIDGGGRWSIEYSDISLNSPAEIKAWEAWNGYLNAGTAPVLVPMLSLETAPRPAYGARGLMPPSDLYTDDPLFPTVTRFQAPYIVATVLESAPLRATTVKIAMVRGAPITGGERVSFGNRGYRIRRRIAADTYQIEPPLRAPVGAGTEANFDWPVTLCLAVPGEDWTPMIELGQYADASIKFVEVAE